MKQIGNNIGYSGAKMISEALKCSSTLTILNLHCDEKEEKKQDETIKKQRKERKECDEMMIMKMKQIDNRIGDLGAKMISEALKSNSTLTILDLSCDE